MAKLINLDHGLIEVLGDRYPFRIRGTVAYVFGTRPDEWGARDQRAVETELRKKLAVRSVHWKDLHVAATDASQDSNNLSPEDLAREMASRYKVTISGGTRCRIFSSLFRNMNHRVPAEELAGVDVNTAPKSWRGTLQVQMSYLRRELKGSPFSIERDSGGYKLTLQEIDHVVPALA